MTKETDLNTEGADFKIAPIATGLRLYVNANQDHGIVQLINVQDNDGLDDLPPEGEHVVAQVAFTPEQLKVVSHQIETLAAELERVAMEKKQEAANDSD